MIQVKETYNNIALKFQYLKTNHHFFNGILFRKKIKKTLKLEMAIK